MNRKSIIFFIVLALSLISEATPERVDIPFNMICTFSGSQSSVTKNYKSERVTYPLLNNKWWAAVSDHTTFRIDEITVTDLFVRAYDYKEQGSLSVLQITALVGEQLVTQVISSNKSNETSEMIFYTKGGNEVKVKCLLK